MADKLPSDNGRSWDQNGVRMITYTAIGEIPNVYRNTLIQLGRGCISARETRSGSYAKLQDELDKYERMLRETFGQQVSRPEFLPRTWGGRTDA